jgi:hypothetical protein
LGCGNNVGAVKEFAFKPNAWLCIRPDTRECRPIRIEAGVFEANNPNAPQFLCVGKGPTFQIAHVFAALQIAPKASL